MGKYMKKSKLRGDVAAKDASQSSLGVRTRAKTQALQRLQSSAESLPLKPDSCYLELRSRRLEKPPLVKKNMQSSEKVSSLKSFSNCEEKYGFGIGSVSKEEGGCFGRKSRASETGDSEIEVSFGENNLESEARERSTRESTPCSLIGAADGITTPGSSTKPPTLNPSSERVQNARPVDMPTDEELEEFFTQMEEAQQRLFIEKYNFDIVNDLPLPGRYEWEKLSTT